MGTEGCGAENATADAVPKAVGMAPDIAEDIIMEADALAEENWEEPAVADMAAPDAADEAADEARLAWGAGAGAAAASEATRAEAARDLNDMTAWRWMIGVTEQEKKVRTITNLCVVKNGGKDLEILTRNYCVAMQTMSSDNAGGRYRTRRVLAVRTVRVWVASWKVRMISRL